MATTESLDFALLGEMCLHRRETRLSMSPLGSYRLDQRSRSPALVAEVDGTYRRGEPPISIVVAT